MVGVLEWCQVTMAGCAAAAAAQVCAWLGIQNLTDVLSPTHPRSPSDLLLVHTMCSSHTVSVADR